MNRKAYSSMIKKVTFKYPVAKKIAGLMLSGYDRNEIARKCIEENYIEIESVERRREITNTVYNRLSSLDQFLLQHFCNDDVATSKFILVYSIIKTDALFFDFIFEIYREALMGNKDYISMDDFDTFFASKKETDLIVAGWGDFTLECLTKGYRNILVESGLGVRDRRNIKAVKMMIHPLVEEHIALIDDSDYLKALLGGE